MIIADHLGGILGASKLKSASSQCPTTQPGFRSLVELAKRSRVLIKISGQYRSSAETNTNFADLAPIVRALVAEVSDSLLWASDWPHTGEGKDRLGEKGAGVIEPFRIIDNIAEYDQVIGLDLSTLEPLINGPFTPDLSTPVSKFGVTATEEAWPPNLSAGLIGSCTNSSFKDMSRAASLGKQALDAGLTPKMPLLVSPGSEQTRATLERAGILDIFDRLESTLLTNACGPCCGSWDRQDVKKVRMICTQRSLSLTGLGHKKLNHHLI